MTSTEEPGYRPAPWKRGDAVPPYQHALYPGNMHCYARWKTAEMCMGLFDERQSARHEWIARDPRREREEAHATAVVTYPASARG